MNLAAENSLGAFYVNFNKDCSSLAVGSKNGYRLYSLSSTEKLEQIDENDSEDICIVELLLSGNLVGTVSSSSPRQLKVCDFKRGTEIFSYRYSSPILSVKLNRSRLIVCLENSIHIYNIDMKVMHIIRDTASNLTGLCALSVNIGTCYLAYPGSNTIGNVQIFDAEYLQSMITIHAHDNPIAAMAFDATGSKIATASKKGTVIRVFTVKDGTPLFEFRPGTQSSTSIYSLAFSLDSSFLCTSNSTETVHIFKLDGQNESINVGKAQISSASCLSTEAAVSLSGSLFKQGHAFATVRLPFFGLKNICVLATIEELPRILVASADGHLYIYNVDVVEGGECSLVKRHRLDEGLVVPPVASPFQPPDATLATSSKERTSLGSGGSCSSSSGGYSYSDVVRERETSEPSAAGRSKPTEETSSSVERKLDVRQRRIPSSSSDDDDEDSDGEWGSGALMMSSFLNERSYVFTLSSCRNRRLDPIPARPNGPAEIHAGGHPVCTCVQYSNGFGVNNAICKCGEDETDFDWTWDRASKSTAAVLSNDYREVKFHTEYSCGTAAVRGNQPMTVSQYYWEVKMTSPVYGTDMMVGVGTSEMDLDKFRHIFGSLLGYDNESWGFSYYGNIHHKGRVKGYSSKFEQGSIIGVHLDMWRGTVAFFNNRQPLGIAYKGLQGKVLYPMVASTAARSGMRVIKSCSFPSSLQFLCCSRIRELVPSEHCVLDALVMPPGLKTFLRNNLDWLLCARASPCHAHKAATAATASCSPSTSPSRDSTQSLCGKRVLDDGGDSETSGNEPNPKRQRVT